MPDHLPMSHLLLSLPLFLFTISTSHGVTTENDSDIPNCPSFNCGNGVEIVYPFWTPNPKPDSKSYCGYPQFQVTCDGENPSFRTISDSYTVKAIDPETRAITLVKADALGSSCPRARQNASIPLLTFADSTTHLVFFFNCTLRGDPRFPEEQHHVKCLDGNYGSSYVFVKEEYPLFSALCSVCKGRTVVAPVLEKKLSNGSLTSNFGRVMNDGFELKWKDSEMEDCMACEKSGGRCWHNSNAGEGLVFQCFCKDGVHYNGHRNNVMAFLIFILAIAMMYMTVSPFPFSGSKGKRGKRRQITSSEPQSGEKETPSTATSSLAADVLSIAPPVTPEVPVPTTNLVDHEFQKPGSSLT